MSKNLFLLPMLLAVIFIGIGCDLLGGNKGTG